MNRFALLFIMLGLLFLSSCSYDELDKIEFVDDFGYVQKSVIEFDSLLTDSNKKCKTNYTFSFWIPENGIEVTDSRGSEEDIKVELSSVCPEAKDEVKRLIEIATILKKNNISYVYKKYGTGVTVFGYRYSFRTHGHSLREIVVDNKNNKLVMINEYRPVDSKGKLLLFALKADN